MAKTRGRSASFITRKKRLTIYLRDNFSCVYCQKSLFTHDIVLSVDHVIPESLGGKHGIDNLVTSCVSCNCSRGNKSIFKFSGRNAVKRVNRRIAKDTTKFSANASKLLKSLKYSEIMENVKNA